MRIYGTTDTASREAEMASASFWCRGELDQNYDRRNTAMSYVTSGPSGIIVQQIYPESRP